MTPSEAMSQYGLTVAEVAAIKRFLRLGLDVPWWEYVYVPENKYAREADDEYKMPIQGGRWMVVKPNPKPDPPADDGWDDDLWE